MNLWLAIENCDASMNSIAALVSVLTADCCGIRALFSRTPVIPSAPLTPTPGCSAHVDGGLERRLLVLLHFLEYLHTNYGITDVVLVGHSNGGMWSCAAIKVLNAINLPIRVRSLVTISTPRMGSIPPRFFARATDISACSDIDFAKHPSSIWRPW